MDLIKHTTEWAKGDALQGKILLFTGLLLIIACFFILKNDNSMLKGSLIPLALLLIFCAGYGGFLTFSRPGHIIKTEKIYAENPQQAVETELIKAERDNKAYSMIKKIWPVLIILTAGIYFLVSTDYLKGLMIGLLVLFVAGLVIDTMLHHRLEPYLKVLRELSGA